MERVPSPVLQGRFLGAGLDTSRTLYPWRSFEAGIAADIACSLVYIHTMCAVHHCGNPLHLTSTSKRLRPGDIAGYLFEVMTHQEISDN
jgi:hypothetical protein